jgi:hypothetical protein
MMDGGCGARLSLVVVWLGEMIRLELSQDLWGKKEGWMDGWVFIGILGQTP